jgi:citrate lyase gamma subunit
MSNDMGARVRAAVAEQIGRVEVLLIEAKVAGEMLTAENDVLRARAEAAEARLAELGEPAAL